MQHPPFFNESAAPNSEVNGESSDLQPKLHHGSCYAVPEQVGKIIFFRRSPRPETASDWSINHVT